MPKLMRRSAQPAAARVARRLMAPHRRLAVSVVAASILGGAAEAGLLVVLSRAALAVAKGERSFSITRGVRVPLLAAIAVGVLLLAVRFAATVASAWASSRLVMRVVVTERQRMIDSFVGAPWPALQALQAGRFQDVVLGLSLNGGVMANTMLTWWVNGINLLTMLIVALIVNLIASIAVVVLVIVLGMVLLPLRKRIARRARITTAAQLDLATTTAELSALGLEMHAFGVADQFRTRFGDAVRKHARSLERGMLLQGLLAPAYTVLLYGAVLGALGLSTFVSESSLDGIAGVLLVMMRSISYAQAMQAATGKLAEAGPGFDAFNSAVQELRAEAVDPEAGVAVDKVGRISFDEVGFAYVADQPVLYDVTFSLRPGEIVGVIGPSGSGKSTLVQLLLGLRRPTSGTVAVDGVDLVDIDRRSWARLVSIVPQEPILLSGTLGEAVRFLRSDITDTDVDNALRRAHLVELVNEHPLGLDLAVGGRGSSISGGQRQRVSIARALAGQPQLLVMDEPTSALDVHSEAMIRRTIDELRGSVTVVVIAHRLSTLERCDRIMVVDHGRIVAFDTPRQLAVDSAFYREALALSGISPEA